VKFNTYQHTGLPTAASLKPNPGKAEEALTTGAHNDNRTDNLYLKHKKQLNKKKT
jgi:hypothetical protein